MALLSRFLEERYPTCLCVLSGPEGADSPYPTCQDVRALAPKRRAGMFGKLLAWLERIYKLQKLKLSFRPTVSISFLEGPDYANILTFLHGERRIASVRGSKLHDTEISGIKGWIRLNVLMPLFYRFANLIVSVSTDLATELIEELGLPRSRVVTIPNFYEGAKIRNLARASVPDWYENFRERPTLTLSGRLHPQKGFIPFLRVIQELKRTRPVRACILGDGELRSRLIEECRALSLTVFEAGDAENRPDSVDVILLGRQNNPFRFVARSDIFVLPSQYEGFPNVLAEAIILGVRCVSADCPTGPREILHPELSHPLLPLDGKFGTLLPLLGDEPTPDLVGLWATAILKTLDSGPLSQATSDSFADKHGNGVMERWLSIVENSTV